MNQVQMKKVIAKAEALCKESKVKLTDKRRNILSVLLSNDGRPMSAYNVADCYKEYFSSTIQVMSVYRMLDFLVEEDLAHKLESTNQYIACSHIACEHEHKTAQFLICDECQSVDEVILKEDVKSAIDKSVESKGFHIQQSQLELHGLCDRCSQH
jgi:Fur family zinc uptake transcriptional regulator